MGSCSGCQNCDNSFQGSGLEQVQIKQNSNPRKPYLIQSDTKDELELHISCKNLKCTDPNERCHSTSERDKYKTGQIKKQLKSFHKYRKSDSNILSELEKAEPLDYFENLLGEEEEKCEFQTYSVVYMKRKYNP